MWEYKVIKENPEKLLAGLGAEGWEMCGCINTPYTGWVVFFKRKISQ
jgi:hypothetical protein